jgi:hypothetical protein
MPTAATMDQTLSDLICRLRHEFLGSPALALTPQQAARLWGLDRTTSTYLLGFLTARGFVHKTPDGTYTRPALNASRQRPAVDMTGPQPNSTLSTDADR